MNGDPVAPEPKNDGLADAAPAASPVDAGPPHAFTHFETSIPTTYELPLDLQPAVLGKDEAVASWLGPVNKLGGSDVTNHLIRTSRSRHSEVEIDKDAVNTLLFTGSQIIGLMLGPDDLQFLRSGPLMTVANQVVVNYPWRRQGGDARGLEFATLNANHWGDMVASLSAQPLTATLGNHLNCGLPYERVQSVKVKNRFINPGLTIYLTDGSYLRYGALGKRGRLTDVANYLKGYVKVQ